MMSTITEPTRAEGLRRLARFVPAAGSRYTKARNFDFGPERRANVSTLSPYLRHRLVLEPEVLEATLQQHSLDEASKFVQEVFWRAYFKGWLEHRPSVWEDYRDDVWRLLRSLDDDAELLQRYDHATGGRTGIDCFDAWAAELVSTGYLHNHARMWFASIWVYTLGLPWQLGADFFLRHLLDGDPASNTLSWRWVCGLHTPGKTYLARPANIARFTDNRFNPDGELAASAPPLSDERTYPLRPLPAAEPLAPGRRFGLLVTEEDGCPEALLGEESPAAVLGALATQLRSPLPIGEPVKHFAAAAVSDAVNRTARHYGIDGEVAETPDWDALLVDWARRHRVAAIVTPYAPVGPVRRMLDEAGATLEREGIRLVTPRRDYDSVAWPHAQRGYFKMKEQIPRILEELGIGMERRPTAQSA
jgi:deoxyribodipyrimidine photo-lyase